MKMGNFRDWLQKNEGINPAGAFVDPKARAAITQAAVGDPVGKVGQLIGKVGDWWAGRKGAQAAQQKQQQFSNPVAHIVATMQKMGTAGASYADLNPFASEKLTPGSPAANFHNIIQQAVQSGQLIQAVGKYKPGQNFNALMQQTQGQSPGA